MKLDKSLLGSIISPVWNHRVDSFLQHMPLYLNQERMNPHHKQLHVQPGIEINISHAGKAMAVVGKNIYVQSSRHLILIPGNIPHQVFPDTSSYRRSVMCFNESFLANCIEDEFKTTLTNGLQYQLEMESYLEITHILQRMKSEMCQQRIGWRRIVLSQLLELSVLLQRSEEVTIQQQEELATSPHNNSENIVHLCCDYISNHMNEDLSLTRMANLFSISTEHLIRLFRQEKGLTYYQYVLLQRVLASKKMMIEHPELSLTEIAYSLGFTSSSQFARSFRRVMHTTPSDFRGTLDSKIK